MIGIIGGNGVAATNKLCELIEEQITRKGGFRDAHHPEMLIWQATKAPSRSMYFEGRGDSFIDDYVRIGKMMKDNGVKLLSMCCNTAHIVVDELEERIGLPFINLLQEVATDIATKKVKKVGIMCSDGLRKFGTYDKVILETCPAIEIVYPDLDFQKLVTKGICNAKNNNRFTLETDEENPYYLFSKVVEHLKDKGCDCVVAGCTDIRNVYYNQSASDLIYIDSLEVLANTIVKKFKEDESY